MTLVSFLLLLTVAGICGAIAKSLGGFSRGGILFSIGVGLFGAALGSWLANSLNMPGFFVVNIGTASFPLIWAIIGSIILVTIAGFLTRSSAAHR